VGQAQKAGTSFSVGSADTVVDDLDYELVIVLCDAHSAEDDAFEGVENREALKPLPDREWRILVLRFFAGMTSRRSWSRWVSPRCTFLGCSPGP
jgi:hypothetical protein